MTSDFFEDDDYYTGPPVTPSMILHAESSLGFRLPTAYTHLLSQRNGGVPHRRCFSTDFETSWAPDHIEISAILGIGGGLGIDSTQGQGSRDLVREWDYPDIGLVVCDTPSGGHDTVMLDYSGCGPQGEPRVAYIDEDRVPRELASTFEEFLSNLSSCPEGE